MIRALYTATSGMLVESRKLDLAAKNLYHAQTPGFKAESLIRAARPVTNPGTPADVQTFSGGGFRDPAVGPLRSTGKPLDLALEGPGFFAVETPGGVGYTRDGRFRRESDGAVRNFSGHALLGEQGAIRFPEAARWDATLEIDEEGTVWVDGQEVDRLLVRDFPGFRGLQEAGGSFFYPTGAEAGVPVETRVIQGTLEDANTSGVAEMTRTLETLRAFEGYQKLIQTVMDDLTGEAVRRIGRVA